MKQKILHGRTKEELIQIDKMMQDIRKKDIEGKVMAIKAYLICMAIGYLIIGIMSCFSSCHNQQTEPSKCMSDSAIEAEHERIGKGLDY